MQGLQQKYMTEVQRIVNKYVTEDDYAVFLFGSLATGKNNDISDIDIGILGSGSFPQLKHIQLKEALEESTIPYKVDVVDFYQASKDFKAIALQHIQVWRNPKNIVIS